MGAKLTDVVRIRMFMWTSYNDMFFYSWKFSPIFFSIDIADQAEVCQAFKETFVSSGIRVPATLVQVNAFVHPDMRVEIEADAIVM